MTRATTTRRRRVITAARHRAARVISRHRASRWAARCDVLARWFLNTRNEAGNWDMHANGEVALLRQLARLEPEIVFDVGAHVGTWTEAALSALPTASMHVFEPVPATFAECAQRLATSLDRVTLQPIGLSDAPGLIEMQVDPAKSTVASMFATLATDQSETVTCRFTTGDEYCSAAGIDHIDVLKVDAEGADHLVLRGFSGLLRTRSIRVVQFEYGSWALDTRFLLADHIRCFAEHGYDVGRLYSTGVEFRSHEPRHEDFRLANYVAIRSDDAEARALVTTDFQRVRGRRA